MVENSGYGHRKMITWQNLDKIEEIIQRKILNLIPKREYNLRDQIDRASSSSVANFIEGYYSGSLKEYVRFLRYSKRSAAELQDWIRRTYFKSYIEKALYDNLDDLLIKTIYLLNRLIASLINKSEQKAIKGRGRPEK